MNDTQIQSRIQSRIQELERAIEPLQTELAKHRQALIESQSEFKRGDIIQWRNRTGRVIDIMISGSFPTWLVAIIRKDGSHGSHVKVRSYENPTLKP